jgi:hypothetical protein
LTVKAKARTSLNVKAASTPKELPAWTQLDVNAASTSKEYSARTTFDVTAHSSHHYDDKTRAASVATVTSHKHTLANTQLALLYSLSTPGSLMAYQFDSDTERICIDTGASACLSTRRDNFISLRHLEDIKINGIASGLKVAGIGVLKWSIRDDNNAEIDLYIKDALYVPDAPMGLLCPQQIAQQTRLKGDGFLALDDCGIPKADCPSSIPLKELLHTYRRHTKQQRKINYCQTFQSSNNCY